MTKNEIALVKRLQNGEEEAFQEIYKIYYPRCKRQAGILCKNEADAHDMAQDALITAYSKISQLKDVNSFDFWIRRIVRYSCISMFRHNQVASYDPEMLLTYNEEERRKEFLPEESFEFSYNQALLRESVSELKPKHREILELYYFEQMSINEISEQLKLPTGTVKSRMFQAKRFLQTKIRAVEKKEGHTINFKVEPILPTLFTILLCKLESCSWSSKALKYTQVASITSCVAVSGAIANDIIKEYNTVPVKEVVVQTPIEPEPVVLKKLTFESISFRELDIVSPKDAYYTLLSLIPTVPDFELIPYTTLQEIKPIVEALTNSTTRYLVMMEESGWLSEYKRCTEN